MRDKLPSGDFAAINGMKVISDAPADEVEARFQGLVKVSRDSANKKNYKWKVGGGVTHFDFNNSVPLRGYDAMLWRTSLRAVFQDRKSSYRQNVL